MQCFREYKEKSLIYCLNHVTLMPEQYRDKRGKSCADLKIRITAEILHRVGAPKVQVLLATAHCSYERFGQEELKRENAQLSLYLPAWKSEENLLADD